MLPESRTCSSIYVHRHCPRHRHRDHQTASECCQSRGPVHLYLFVIVVVIIVIIIIIKCCQARARTCSSIFVRRPRPRDRHHHHQHRHHYQNYHHHQHHHHKMLPGSRTCFSISYLDWSRPASWLLGILPLIGDQLDLPGFSCLPLGHNEFSWAILMYGELHCARL